MDQGDTTTKMGLRGQNRGPVDLGSRAERRPPKSSSAQLLDASSTAFEGSYPSYMKSY